MFGRLRKKMLTKITARDRMYESGRTISTHVKGDKDVIL